MDERLSDELDLNRLNLSEEYRAAILEGYADVLAGRVLEYKGSIEALIEEAKRRWPERWADDEDVVTDPSVGD